ncbi:hypothetical protein GCM10023108_25290 [Saccharopolyspora hordei]
MTSAALSLMVSMVLNSLSERSQVRGHRVIPPAHDANRGPTRVSQGPGRDGSRQDW